MPYCTAEEAKTRTGKTLSQDILNAAQALIESTTRICWESQTATDEEYVGDGQCWLFLRNYPVSVVTVIKIDDESKDITQFEINKERNAIYYGSGWDSSESENIKITYTYGYATIPENVKLATAQIAILMISNPANLLSQGLGKINISYGVEYGGIRGILKRLPHRRAC